MTISSWLRACRRRASLQGLAALLVVVVAGLLAGKGLIESASASTITEVTTSLVAWPIDSDDSRMIAVELVLCLGFVFWALLGPGAGRRWPPIKTTDRGSDTDSSENGQ